MEDRKFLLKQMPANSICAEIGVWKGRFSGEILEEINPKKLHLIDPWEFQEEFPDRLYSGGKTDIQNQGDMDKIYERICKRFYHHKNVEIHRAYSEKIDNLFENDYFDWMYVDGNHDYEYVLNDLRLCHKKTKNGGYICGDDVNWEGVSKAVADFVAETSIEVITLQTNKQFILRKGKL